MYLVIFEDGSMQHMTQLDVGTLFAADDGLVEVVDISNPEHPLRYFDEGWCSVDVHNARVNPPA